VRPCALSALLPDLTCLAAAEVASCRWDDGIRNFSHKEGSTVVRAYEPEMVMPLEWLLFYSRVVISSKREIPSFLISFILLLPA
jgi:hypothetical protein